MFPLKNLRGIIRTNRLLNISLIINETTKGIKSSSRTFATTTATQTSSKVTHADSETHPDTAKILERQSNYFINTYNRPPIIFSRGKGCFIYDLADREYLDFSSGIATNAFGHADEEVANVLSEQARKLVHTSNLYFNEHAGRLAELLVKSTKEGGGFDAAKVFFANTGTEANEGAFKFVRKWAKVSSGKQDKIGIVSFTNAFHGRTLGSLSATHNIKQQIPYAPLVPGFTFAPFNDTSKINEHVNQNTCAVIIEPIQGEGGLWVATQEFLEALRKRCDEVGALLIYDEVQCGLGRTGKFWAHQRFPKSCHPDILTMAKPLANGYPIGAVMTTQRVADSIEVGDHGSTFGGGPLACKLALSVIKRINSPELLANVNKVGEFFMKETPLLRLARERGLLIITSSNHTIRFLPPLIIKVEEAKHEEDFLNSSNSSNRQLDSNSPGFHKLRPSDTQGYIKTNIHDDSTRPDYMISPLENGLRDSMSTLKKHPYEGYSSLWKGQFATWLYEIGYLYFQPNLEGKLNETFDLYDDTIPLIYLDHATPNVVTKVASHLIVGVLLSPLEIVRTRLIVQSSSPSHKKYNGTFNCLSQIIREEGFSSLYWSHNLLPSIVYHTVVPLLQCTRDLFIERIFHISPTESPILFGFAQFGLSTLQLIITLPLETIRKRLQCQIKTRKPGRPFKTIVQTRQAHYFGMLDATYRIVLEEGISQKYVSDNDGTSHPSLNKLKRNKRRQRGWLDNYGIGNLYQGFYMHLTMNFATFLFQVVNGNEDEYDDI
ncbi:11816_t:CDS:2 [Entrophospora sp. SA101]|nr:11816_t:CDS:2 [Entrophospora sp. SA101]